MAESAWQKFAAVGLPWRDPPQQPPERQYFYSDGDKVQSLHSRFRVNLVLTNRTRHNVEVYWVDFDGRESFYGTMEPWSTILVYTFLTHPFVFRSKAHAIGDLLVNNLPVCWPSSSHPFQEVTEAQFCAWTPASHASYFRPKFPQFAAAVRQLLLACNAQHKRPGSRRSSAGGGGGEENLGGCKSRRSSSTGSESGVGEAGCCGQLWKKPGEGTAGTPGVSAVEPQGQASLGLLPYDLVLKIISYLAPPLHFVLPVGKEAVEMLPPSVEHSAQPPVVFMAARLLGPRAPKQPTAGAAAWVAAATIVQRAGGGPPGMQLLPAGAWPLANGVAVDRAAQLLAGAAQQAQHAVIAQAVAAAAEPEAPLPDGTHEVLQFTEALALAHLAFMRVTQMACQQEAQAPVLWQYVKAAREAAGKRGAQDRLAALQQHSTVAMTSQEWQRRLAPWPLEDSMFTPVVAPR